ncbi:TPR repeat protein [Agrobacterium vitis]|nr:TPR repeat protein [Agrobacterium vitis]MBE1439711.1 TPR repeat protein [Agrobacterium vitis]
MRSLLHFVHGFSIRQAYRLGMRKLADGRMPVAAAALKRAANGGHVGACYEMARLYEMGRGVICDLSEARRLARFAADSGHVPSMSLAARLFLISPERRLQATPSTNQPYGYAEELTSEPEMARRYAMLAHHHGNVDGSALAGYLFASGIGGPADARLALACYQPAVQVGNVRAHLGMGTLFAGGHLGVADYARALPYFKYAAASGNSTARHYLALQFLKGLGTERDEERALKLFSAAAAKGYRASIEELAAYYLDEAYPQRDRARGIHWLTALGRMGDQRACRELERRYRHGIDVPVNGAEAVIWLEKAALKGDVAAQFQMAVIAATGGGEDEADYVQARLWFEMAADNGHTIAMVNLGRFRMKGVGGDVDLEGAQDILEIAIEAGEMAAYAILGEFYAYYAEPANIEAAREILMHGVEKDDAVCKNILARLEEEIAVKVA